MRIVSQTKNLQIKKLFVPKCDRFVGDYESLLLEFESFIKIF